MFIFLVSCFSSKEKQIELGDYSLDDDDSNSSQDYSDGIYLNDLYSTRGSISIKSSFPFKISVDRAVDNFDSIPKQAKKPSTSQIKINIKNCSFYLRTGNIKADHYIYTDKWINHENDIQKNRTLRVGHENSLFLEFHTQLEVALLKKSYNRCRKLLEGRSIYLGKYNISKSRMNLIGKKGSYKPRISVYKGKKDIPVYMYWLKGKKMPFMLDNLENNIILHTPKFRSEIKRKSFYFVTFTPKLSYSNSNNRTINIPFKPLVH